MGLDELNATELSKYYDEHFHELHNQEAEELRWKMICTAIVKCYNSSMPKNLVILDLGCSSGWLSKKLSVFGNVTGIDFSEQSIREAKKQYPEIDFKTIDITSSEINSLGKESFDLIVSSEVMEHVENHKLFIDKISFLLKDRGVLILTTPNGRWYNSYFTKEMQPFKQPVENWITGKKLKTLLSQKFNSITLKTFYVNWMYSSKNSILLKILANNYLRAVLKKTGLFNSYLKFLENCGSGLYLIVSAKKQNSIL